MRAFDTEEKRGSVHVCLYKDSIYYKSVPFTSASGSPKEPAP